MTSPVMKFGDTVARNATTSAMSSGVPILRRGIASMISLSRLIEQLIGQVGADRAWTDRVHRHMRRELLAECARQTEYARLGSAIRKPADCVGAGPHVSADGGYVYNPPTLPLEHRRCNCFAPSKAALQIDRDRLIVLLFADLEERLGLRDPGIVYEHVDAPPFLENGATMLQHPGIIGDAPRQGDRIDADAPDLLGRIIHLVNKLAPQRVGPKRSAKRGICWNLADPANYPHSSPRREQSLDGVMQAPGGRLMR